LRFIKCELSLTIVERIEVEQYMNVWGGCQKSHM
jgi:hypothetical protein